MLNNTKIQPASRDYRFLVVLLGCITVVVASFVFMIFICDTSVNNDSNLQNVSGNFISDNGLVFIEIKVRKSQDNVSNMKVYIAVSHINGIGSVYMGRYDRGFYLLARSFNREGFEMLHTGGNFVDYFKALDSKTIQATRRFSQGIPAAMIFKKTLDIPRGIKNRNALL